MGNSYISAFPLDAQGERITPFLKWPGGKQWLVGRLSDLVPEDWTYYEPFLGGGSLFFASQPEKSLLGDINPDLVEAYRAVRDNPSAVIQHLEKWPNSESEYYKIRGSTFRGRFKRAARFIYLNRTCWNGLYRVNKTGNFNVPYGNHSRTIVQQKSLLASSKILKNVDLICADFRTTLKNLRKPAFIYLDPPYTVSHNNNGFLRYNEDLFSLDDQVELACLATKLSASDCKVLVSNANHEVIDALYTQFRKYTVDRKSLLSSDPSHRGETSEALFASFELPSSVLTQEA